MIKEIRKVKNGAIHIISMCRMDRRQYLHGTNLYNAKELLKNGKQNKKNIKRSKRHKLYYIEMIVDYKGIKVKLFFTRLTKRAKWRLLVTTNTSLSFSEVYDLYANRWAIEVFFKESKQFLGLGKNQSRDFDAQIAATTISFIQYIILSLYKRSNDYETIGGLFRNTKDDIIEQIFSDRIRVLIVELIKNLVQILNIEIELEETISALIENVKIESKIELIFSTSIDKGRKIVT